MPRRGRVILPNTPHHIVQRGHNRNAVFVEDADYQYYLDNLQGWKENLGVKVFSYCLMTNHVHLVVQPGIYPTDVSELMKRLAGRQTRYVNRLEGRRGTLWDGRFKISPIETDSYLLQCCRYVELNPVKACMVKRADDYRWSSYRTKIGFENSPWLDFDPCYLELAANAKERIVRYQRFVEDRAAAGEVGGFIGRAIERNQLTAGQRFIDEVEHRYGLRIESRGRGRPSG